jgi:predicted flavoprotein YhiN
MSKRVVVSSTVVMVEELSILALGGRSWNSTPSTDFREVRCEFGASIKRARDISWTG